MKVSNNIYNHLGATLVPKKRNTTHKSSELKELYTKMAKYNKNSPLYLLSMNESKVSRMIDIKEAAITLRDSAEIFADTDSPMYKKKLFHSEDDTYISGSIRGNDLSDIPDELTVSVKELAKGQINTGKYLDKNELNIAPGRYSFRIESIDGDSEHNFTVNPDDTNYDLQKKLVDSINNKAPGIKASIVDDGSSAAIMLASKETGSPSTADGLNFSLSRDEASSIINDIFGLDNVSEYPGNSVFTINGDEHTSTSNNISINQTLELDFHKATGSDIKISLVPDTSELKEQLGAFVDAYNNLVDLGKNGDSSIGRSNLLNDISGLVRKHTSELKRAGITVDDTGHLIQEKDTSQGADISSFSELFDKLSTFKSDVDATAQKLTLDPMAYINKLIVTYPNTNNKQGATYTQSLYSGLMFNNYA